MKVWLMVAFIHSPQMPSIKYQAYLYETEDQCMENLVLLQKVQDH